MGMVTYNRLRDVVVWIFALKDVFLKRGDAAAPSAEGAAPQVEQYYFESDDAKAEALQRLKKRLKVLLVLFGIFLLFVLQDSRRRRRAYAQEVIASRVWSKVAGHLPPALPPPPLQPPGGMPPGMRGGMGGMDAGMHGDMF